MFQLSYNNEDENQIVLSSQNNSQNDEIIISNNQLINNNNNGMTSPINGMDYNAFRNGFNRFGNMINNRFEQQNNLITNLQNQNNQLQLQLKQQNEEIQNDLNNIKNRNMTENEMQFRRSAASILSGYSENQQIQNINVDGLINNNNLKNIYEQDIIEDINQDFINDFSNDLNLNERIKLNNNNLKEIKQINPFNFNQEQQELLNKDLKFEDIIKKDECEDKIEKALIKSDMILTLNNFNGNEITYNILQSYTNKIASIFKEKGNSIKNEKYKILYNEFILWLLNRVNGQEYNFNYNIININNILTIYKYLVNNYKNSNKLPDMIIFYTVTYFKSLSNQEDKGRKIKDFNDLLKIMQQVAKQTVILSDNFINLTNNVNALINDNDIQNSLNRNIMEKVYRILQMIDVLKNKTNTNIANISITNENLRTSTNEIIVEINKLIVANEANKSAYVQLLNLVNRLNLLFNGILNNDKSDYAMKSLEIIIKDIENLRNHDFPQFQQEKLQKMFEGMDIFIENKLNTLNDEGIKHYTNLRDETSLIKNEINQKIEKMEKENEKRDLLINGLQNITNELNNQKVDIINDINKLKKQNEQLTNFIKTIAEQNNKITNNLTEINTILSKTNENIDFNNKEINNLKEFTKDLNNRIEVNENKINQHSSQLSIIENKIKELENLKNQINDLKILNENKIINNKKIINKGKSLNFDYDKKQEFINDINHYIDSKQISSDYNLDYDKNSISITQFLINQLDNFNKIFKDDSFNISLDINEKKLYYLQFLKLIYSKIFSFTWGREIQKEIQLKQIEINKIMEKINDINDNDLSDFINNQIDYIKYLIDKSKNNIYRKLDYDDNNSTYTNYRIIIDDLINSLNEEEKDNKKINVILNKLLNIFSNEHFKDYLNNNEIKNQISDILKKLNGKTLQYDEFSGFIFKLIDIINQLLNNYKNSLKGNLNGRENLTNQRRNFIYEKLGNIHKFTSN